MVKFLISLHFVIFAIKDEVTYFLMFFPVYSTNSSATAPLFFEYECELEISLRVLFFFSYS